MYIVFYSCGSAVSDSDSLYQSDHGPVGSHGFTQLEYSLSMSAHVSGVIHVVQKFHESPHGKTMFSVLSGSNHVVVFSHESFSVSGFHRSVLQGFHVVTSQGSNSSHVVSSSSISAGFHGLHGSHGFQGLTGASSSHFTKEFHFSDSLSAISEEGCSSGAISGAAGFGLLLVVEE